MIGYFDLIPGNERFRAAMNDDRSWSCEDQPTLDLLNILFGPGSDDDNHRPYGVGRLDDAATFFGKQAVVLVPPLPELPPGFKR